MQDFFLAALDAAGDAGLTAPALVDIWATEIGDASLCLPPVRETFRMNRVTPCLKRLKAKGLVDCEPIPGGGHNAFVWKRIKHAARRR